eukprot:5621-Eustigmatos_ZCMA.PRE.1
MAVLSPLYYSHSILTLAGPHNARDCSCGDLDAPRGRGSSAERAGGPGAHQHVQHGGCAGGPLEGKKMR